MMKNKYLTGLLPLLVFAVFSIAILGTLVCGTKLYKDISERDDASFSYRTATQFISTKIKQAEKKEDISVEKFDGRDAVVIRSNDGGVECLTRLYEHDGYLCELYSLSESSMDPLAGEPILPINGFAASIEEGTLEIELEFFDDTRETLNFYLFAEVKE